MAHAPLRWHGRNVAKFRMARKTRLRSSCPTTHALSISQLRRHLHKCQRILCPAPGGRPWTSPATPMKAMSAIGPYLMTSARPADSSRCGRYPGWTDRKRQQRLVESANHVLAQRVVDGRLAPTEESTRQQGRGHLDKGHAAHIAGGCKALSCRPPRRHPKQRAPSCGRTRSSIAHRRSGSGLPVLCSSPSGS